MSKFKKLLVSASIASVMSFAAGHAAADTVLAPISPVTVNVNGTTSTSFSQSTVFSLDSLSEVAGSVFLYKKAGTGTSALQSIAATLWQKTGSSWTSVWTDTASFAQSSHTSTWSSSFDQSPLAAGLYKLTLTGSIFSGTKLSAYYNYNLSISPVPEPETYALMGVGLAAVLLRLRKKKVSGTAAVAV
ncbi:FxDxF family PEP-CTERM protein [Aquitalea sp. ASV11]|uniref:FxDxF family PEP-CTERM protein n=1 Tax=Aquitalea sp. ASV11 TaxID=2795103 RepID=UPI0018EC6C37|nr:FxDxF family PEP-CTERM protein [Aquitalea sp. ASV11]